jgi:hypothetical protein
MEDKNIKKEFKQQHSGQGNNIQNIGDTIHGNKTTNIVVKRVFWTVLVIGIISLIGLDNILGLFRKPLKPLADFKYEGISSPYGKFYVDDDILFVVYPKLDQYMVGAYFKLYNFKWIIDNKDEITMPPTEGKLGGNYFNYTFKDKGQHTVKLLVTSKENPDVSEYSQVTINVTEDPNSTKLDEENTNNLNTIRANQPNSELIEKSKNNLENFKSSSERQQVNLEGIIQNEGGNTLILRTQPSINAGEILRIPNGSSLIVLEIGLKDNISEYESNWLRVKYNEKTGWVWGRRVVIK